MQKAFASAQEIIKKSENKKYDDPNNKILKREYLNKNYTIDQRTNLKDLIKFYSDWLYSPVDEELENKIYFMEFSQDNKQLPVNTKSFEDLFYNNLKEEFEIQNLEDKFNLTRVYGLKINTKI